MKKLRDILFIYESRTYMNVSTSIGNEQILCSGLRNPTSFYSLNRRILGANNLTVENDADLLIDICWRYETFLVYI